MTNIIVNIYIKLPVKNKALCSTFNEEEHLMAKGFDFFSLINFHFHFHFHCGLSFDVICSLAIINQL